MKNKLDNLKLSILKKNSAMNEGYLLLNNFIVQNTNKVDGQIPSLQFNKSTEKFSNKIIQIAS